MQTLYISCKMKRGKIFISCQTTYKKYSRILPRALSERNQLLLAKKKKKKVKNIDVMATRRERIVFHFAGGGRGYFSSLYIRAYTLARCNSIHT